MIAEINGTHIRIKNSIPPVQGAVGIKMRAAFSEEWSPLAVTAVFRAGTVQRDVIVEDGELTIPWEVLQKAGCPLYLNFYGAEDSGAVVLKTVQVELGTVAPSPDPSGEAPEAPTPARADQIQALAEAALSTAREVQAQAASGAFDGRDGINGTNGTNGVSPRITVSETTGGHTVHITDAAGESSFDVLDGAPGEVSRAELASALATKAESDGSYDSMTVGNAKQLVATVGVTDRTPYIFRTAGGSADIGDRAVDKLVGGTICWNQLKQFSDMNPKSGNGYVTAKNADSFTTTYDGTAYDNWAGQTSPSVRTDRVYLFRAKVLPSFDTKVGFTGAGDICPTICPPNVETTVSAIRKPSSEIYGNVLSTTVAIKAWEASVQRGVEIPAGSTVTIREFECFDLTQMFGAKIADHVYALEQATPGAGVAWFKKLFPKPFYAYNPGELISVKAAARRTVGFNAYDHATGKAKLVGGMPYQITGAYTALTLDGKAITPDAGGYFTPANSGELTVTGGDSATTCVHLVWDGERDGEYAPYEEHNYPLDDTLTLRGVPKLDSGNDLYFDGDTYESDGTVTRFYQQRPYQTGDEARPDVLTDGANTVVKLSVPETEAASSYITPQIVDDFGTEEYIVPEQNGVAVPVGHETVYQVNLRAKLEMAPESPDGDGDYIVRQTNGENRYVPLTVPAELPPAPSADGTYRLQITVSGGTPMLSWVST